MLDDDRRKPMPTIGERMHGLAAYGRSAAMAKLLTPRHGRLFENRTRCSRI
jgi:hypothetical protein